MHERRPAVQGAHTFEDRQQFQAAQAGLFAGGDRRRERVHRDDAGVQQIERAGGPIRFEGEEPGAVLPEAIERAGPGIGGDRRNVEGG